MIGSFKNYSHYIRNILKLLDRLVRFYYTVKYIRLIQIYYQVWYRVKRNILHIDWYKKYVNSSFVFYTTLTDKLLYVPESAIVEELTFKFLGLTHQFNGKVDWTFTQYGKLWNYNLQYLHYLLDDTIPENHRRSLLEDISQQLLSGKLLLEPYPVSLRIINTLLFLQRTGIRDSRIEQALLQQIDYLDHNLEYHLLANHLLENIYALFISAQYLKNKHLSKKYEQRLLRQLQEQILPDGGHYECSPMYQSILLAKLLLCIEVSEQSSLVSTSCTHELKKIASKMAGWLQTYSFPDGSWALFNDAAEGIAPTTAQIKKAVAYLNIPISDTKLKESGFCKMHGENWEMIVKTGAVQPRYQPGHAHADIGSFCVWYQGMQYIVDPGISTYEVSGQRSWERSTLAHNTVAIGSISQSDVWGGFRVGERASVAVEADTENAINIKVKGYGGKAIDHYRCFVGKSGAILVTDKVDRRKVANCLASVGNILFNPAIDLEKADNNSLRAGPMMIVFDNGNFEVHETTMATKYNELSITKRVAYKIGTATQVTFKFR